MNQTQEHNLKLALQLAAQGVFVFPCVGRGERRKSPCPGVAWRSMSTTDTLTIERWWQRWPDSVPAIDMGRSERIAIDCDTKQSDGKAWLQKLAEEISLDLESVPGSDTPSGGTHYIFRNPLGLGNSRGRLPDKTTADIDVRGKGGYIIAPGAKFADGNGGSAGCYVPRGNLASVIDLPEELAELLVAHHPPPPVHQTPTFVHQAPPPVHQTSPSAHKPSSSAVYVPAEPVSDMQRRAYGLNALEGAMAEVASAQVGERNELINAKAYHLGRLVGAGYLTAGEAYSGLEQAAWSLGLPGRDKCFGAKGTIWRAIEAGVEKPHDALAGREQPAVIIDIATRAPRIHLDFGAGSRAYEAQQQAVPLISAGLLQWDDLWNIPPRDWIYKPHLIRKFCSATIAAGGTGKSSLLIAEALALVTGRNLLGVEPCGKMKVWLWNGEDPLEEIQRRIAATCRQFQITPLEIEGGLFVNSGRDSEIVVAKMVRNELKVNQSVIDALERTISDNCIDVIQIDPFISSHRINENDNVAMDQVLKEWAKLADRCGIAVDLSHHSKKTGGREATVEDGRGASALISAVRSARVLNTMNEQEAAKASIQYHRSYFRVTNGKLNLAPPPDKVDWFHMQSVYLHNGDRDDNLGRGDSVGVVTQWAWPDFLDDVTEEDFAKVSAVIRGAQWRYSSQAKKWVGYALVQALGQNRLDLTTKAGRGKALAMLRVWLRTGRLKVVSGPDEKRMEKEFVEVVEQPEEIILSRPVEEPKNDTGDTGDEPEDDTGSGI